MERLSEERLGDLRQLRRDIVCQPYTEWGMSYLEDISDAVGEMERLRAAIQRWVDADRACEALVDSDEDIIPPVAFNEAIQALHAAQDGFYEALGLVRKTYV